MGNNDNKNFDDLIIRRVEPEKKESAPQKSDAIITRRTDIDTTKPKSSLVTPAQKIDITRAPEKEKKEQEKAKQEPQNQIKTDMSQNPFEKEKPKSSNEMVRDFNFEKPNDPVLPTRTGFSVKNPNKSASKESPKKVEVITRIDPINAEMSKDKITRVEQSKPKVDTIDQAEVEKIRVKRPGTVDDKPIVQDPNAKDRQKVEFVKPEIKKEPQPQVIEKVEPEKPEVQILGEVPKPEKQKKEPPKQTEPEVHKTTTSTLKKKPGTEIPEDASLDKGAKAGSKKYKADTRIDRRAKSLKKYGKEFEKWKRSQELPEDDEYIEGDALVKEGKNSERVITTALVMCVILVLSLFLLFYCNIIVPNEQYDDGRVRISVEIDKDAFYDVDIYGNLTEKEVYPGDYIDFNVKATNAYNIKGDNATSFIWDSIFVRFKVFLRIDGVDYETVKINLSNTGVREVPVIIPTITEDIFQTYDKELEDEFVDQITGLPIVQQSDGFYYYNGILDYNQSLDLCRGILLNGEAIIPEFANKRVELVFIVDAATADYTSIRERTIWPEAPQTWINYMHDKYFPNQI